MEEFFPRPLQRLPASSSYRPLVHIPDLGKEFTFSGIAAKRTFVQGQPNIVRGFMAALTDGAKIYKEDNRAAVRVLRKYLRAEDRTLEGGLQRIRRGHFQSALSGS